MNKKQVIREFCLQSAIVGNHLNNKHASDCFCGLNEPAMGDFEFEPIIIEFIATAVTEKIARDSR